MIRNLCIILIYSTKKLHNIAAYLNLIPNIKELAEGEKYDKHFIIELLVGTIERCKYTEIVLFILPLKSSFRIL